MEGLIPVVYKSFKKNRTRLKYECLSSGATQAYNVKDFYARDDDDHDHHLDHFSRKQQLMPEADGRGSHHRRCNSFHGDHFRSFASEDDAYKPKQLVRFRSQRMLSCLTGA